MVGVRWIAGTAGFIMFSLWGIGILKISSSVINFALTMYYKKDDKKSINH